MKVEWQSGNCAAWGISSTSQGDSNATSTTIATLQELLVLVLVLLLVLQVGIIPMYKRWI